MTETLDTFWVLILCGHKCDKHLTACNCHLILSVCVCVFSEQKFEIKLNLSLHFPVHLRNPRLLERSELPFVLRLPLHLALVFASGMKQGSRALSLAQDSPTDLQVITMLDYLF